ncbi:histidine phosphatase family protein [Kribbella sp. NBC_00889]|uniref:histidine phosphatase family protein n=1 Tax=Kribbella sp. NBC_00889 TaxID=2975974 RepID=UPI0038665F2C|nr:histidine phosphatase family protein [Kribbella sp. NBC_00889]
MSRTELVLLRHGESLWNAEARYQGQQGTGLSALGHQQAKLAAEYLRSGVFDQIVASDLQRVTETLQPYLDSLPTADTARTTGAAGTVDAAPTVDAMDAMDAVDVAGTVDAAGRAGTVGTVDAVDAAGGRGAGCSEWGGRPVVRVDRRWREIDVGSWGGRTFADVYADEPAVVEAFRRGEDVARGGGETFAQLRERVWDAIREIAGSGARRVLVVTHGGPIRVATASTLRLPPGGEVLLDPPVNCSLTTIQVDDLLAVTTLTAYNVPTSGLASTEEQPA